MRFDPDPLGCRFTSDKKLPYHCNHLRAHRIRLSKTHARDAYRMSPKYERHRRKSRDPEDSKIRIRARLQPCRNWCTIITALAAELRSCPRTLSRKRFHLCPSKVPQKGTA